MEAAALERAQRPVGAAASLREEDHVDAAPDAGRSPAQRPHGAVPVRAIDHDRVGERERPTEEGDAQELPLGDEAEGDGHGGDDRRDVEDALVVRHQHVGAVGIDVLEAVALDADAAAREDPTHPGAPDPHHRLAAAVDQRSQHGEGAPEDGVDAGEEVANDVDHRTALALRG